MSEVFDVAIVGAGMAGASLAYFLAPGTRVLLLEAERAPGYHTTGRSAAFYSETYGGPAVQPLSSASRAFFDKPPPGFTELPLLAPRGCLHVARAGCEDALDAIQAAFAGSGVAIERTMAAAHDRGVLAPEWRGAALWEPGCSDMDVGEIHRGFLGGARRHGARLVTDARLEALERGGAGWRLRTSAGAFEAGNVVNAAGAWADAVAAMAGAAPLGIAPLRRTVAQVEVSPPPPRDLPLVMDAAGDFYFRPEGERLWVSPHDEVPDVAGDSQPDELDVATAIDRLESASLMRVRRVERAWAGLRCFAPDRAPVYGWDVKVPGFFWCAGQGGFGIQTAPAAGMLAAALLEEQALPETLAAFGIDPERYAPGRFNPSATETPVVR